jgi:hypothetical protein
VDDFVAARMDLVQGCTTNRRELLYTTPPLSYISSSASYTPAILATARRLPTTEEFNQVIAPTPVSAAPPATPALAPQPSTPRLEPISEEEVESPASLGLTLGRPREVFDISD